MTNSFTKIYEDAGHDVEGLFETTKQKCKRCDVDQIDLSEDLMYGDMRKCTVSLVIDLEVEFMKSLYKAVSESTWIPTEYMMNDWISDCAHFLRTGEGIHVTKATVFELETREEKIKENTWKRLKY